jgi:hypothetical protein
MGKNSWQRLYWLSPEQFGVFFSYLGVPERNTFDRLSDSFDRFINHSSWRRSIHQVDAWKR